MASSPGGSRPLSRTRGPHESAGAGASAHASSPEPRGFREARVGACHVQTPGDRYGDPTAAQVIRDRADAAAQTLNWMDSDSDDEPAPPEPDQITTENPWPQPGPAPLEHRIPVTQYHRNNLTAMSQRHNLYFAAYGNRVFVYRPASAPARPLGPDPDLILATSPDRVAQRISPSQDAYRPHQSNAMRTGFLGSKEILALAYDDGSVFAFYVDAIATYVERRAVLTAATHPGPVPVPFFRDNAGASAWGLAIHQASRLIAVSTNHRDITVFAFGLSPEHRRDPCHDDHDGKPPARDAGSAGTTPAQARCIAARFARRRSRNCRILLLLGPGADNIPNISFWDDKDGAAQKICAIDIRGAVWVLDIWKPFCAPVRIPALQDGTFHAGLTGWDVLLLPHTSFVAAAGPVDALGLPASDVRVVNGKADITASLAAVVDNPVAADPTPIWTVPPPAPFHFPQQPIPVPVPVAPPVVPQQAVNVLPPLMPLLHPNTPPAAGVVVVPVAQPAPAAAEATHSGAETVASDEDEDDDDDDDDDDDNYDYGPQTTTQGLPATNSSTVPGLGPGMIGSHAALTSPLLGGNPLLPIGAFVVSQSQLSAAPPQGPLSLAQQYLGVDHMDLAHPYEIDVTYSPFPGPAHAIIGPSSPAATRATCPVAGGPPFPLGLRFVLPVARPPAPVLGEAGYFALLDAYHEELVYMPHRGAIMGLPLAVRDRVRFFQRPYERNSAKTPQDLTTDRLARCALLRTYDDDVELVNMQPGIANVMCRRPAGQPERPGPPQRIVTHRLNMTIHLPELSLVVIGSPLGRVVLLTPTRVKGDALPLRPGADWARLKYGFRIDCVLPRASEERQRLARRGPLYGIAAAPAPEAADPVGRGSLLLRRPGSRRRTALGPGTRRYRLVLHFHSHTIVTYELSRDDAGALQIF